MSLPFYSTAPQFKSGIVTQADILTMPAFNALTALGADNTAGANACDPTLGTQYIKNLVGDFKYGGGPIESNFFREAFGTTFINGGQDTMVETTDIYNHYTTDIDYNVAFSSAEQSSGPGDGVWVRLARSYHGASGAFSYPTIGYNILDKNTNAMYIITDEDKTVDYSHRFFLIPLDANVVASFRTSEKYFVSPAMLTGGCSCPVPTNPMITMGYVQLVRPFRLRRDWKICTELDRGYQNLFRFRVMFDINGNPYDTWEAYEKVKATEDLKVALNVLDMFGSPITNPAALAANYGVELDSRHTGFYGFLPTLENSAPRLDYDPGEGLSFENDVDPFMLHQDSLKRTNQFLVLHGKLFKYRLLKQLNDAIRFTGLGTCMFDAYSRAGNEGSEIVTKYGIDSYKDRTIGYQLDFKELSPLSDYRFIGNDKLSGTGIFLASKGVKNAKTNQETSPVEFYQYGMSKTGGYIESVHDNWKINGCETIEGHVAESTMMAVHAPEMHALSEPVSYC